MCGIVYMGDETDGKAIRTYHILEFCGSRRPLASLGLERQREAAELQEPEAEWEVEPSRSSLAEAETTEGGFG